jgi:ribosome-associated toxin RatA of RatAB toxin-antitoxin module
MKWLAIGLAIVVGLVAVTAAVGWMLPVGHQATRSGLVGASPRQVFGAISDVANHPSWRPDVSRVEMVSGAGVGARYREHGSHGPIIFRIEQVDAPTLFRVRIDDPEQPFGGTWTFTLAPDGTGTRVTITEDGEVYNPIFRFLSRFVFSQTATMDAYLDALQRRFPA